LEKSHKAYSFDFKAALASRGTTVRLQLPRPRLWLARALVRAAALAQEHAPLLFEIEIQHMNQEGMTGWENPVDRRDGVCVCNTRRVRPGTQVLYRLISLHPLKILGGLVKQIGDFIQWLSGH
jgi:hypothetical protein